MSGQAASGGRGMDRESGAIHVDGLGVPITADLTLKDFLRASGMQDARGSAPGSGYYLGVRSIASRRCHVTLQFNGTSIETVDVCLDSAELPPGDAEDVQKLHAAHRAWMRELLGQPQHASSVGNDSYTFPMGGIGANYDPRSDSATITARYRWMGKPWAQA